VQGPEGAEADQCHGGDRGDEALLPRSLLATALHRAGGRVLRVDGREGFQDRSRFGIAGVWENWRDPATSEWLRTFAIITVPANALVSRIHDRMPAILAPDEFDRWLSADADPRDLMRPFEPDLMTMWPVSSQPEE
jgi:hypothetical protein